METKITEPQMRLLLKLHARPKAVHPDYRPLKALIEHDLVRARHLGQFGSNPTYECSETGAKIALATKELLAARGQSCTCARVWDSPHNPQCPAAAKLSLA
jgi:1-deoxy-D-xylulose 5-phosphate reductoisomerase